MKHANMYEALQFNDETISMELLYETPYVRELRMAMRTHQVMRDHESIFPLTIEVCDGAVTVSADSGDMVLPKGEILTINGGCTHHIEAIQDTIIRLTIFLTPTREGSDD
jgi:quercetin dioxygenase-like cupin family protein